MEKFNYIDLYSGIGGFKYSLDAIGGNCIFSAEINKPAIYTYVHNHGFSEDHFGDMDMFRNMDSKDIKKLHWFKNTNVKVIAAGFPCQTFSVAGNRQGFNSDDTRGTQFFNVLKLVEALKPDFVLLENVKNLTTHDEGKTYKVIIDSLVEKGYNIEFSEVLSPLQVGVPQNRDRIFIVARKIGSRSKFNKIDFSPKRTNEFKNIKQTKILDNNKKFVGIEMSKIEKDALNAWTEFVKLWKKHRSQDENSIPTLWLKEMMSKSNPVDETFKPWKISMINNMRNFYKENKSWIDQWYKKYDKVLTKRIHRKLEWNAGPDYQPEETIAVIRQSGVRFKRPNFFPALVAVVDIPIVYDNSTKQWRNLSINEMVKLQSYSDVDFTWPEDQPIHELFKQLGNSVNVKLVKEIVKQLEIR